MSDLNPARGCFFAREEIFPYSCRKKLFGQQTDFSCVAAVARMILAEHGVEMPEAFLRDALAVTFQGALLSSVVKVLIENEIAVRYRFRDDLIFSELEQAVLRGAAAVNVREEKSRHSHAVLVDEIKDGLVSVRDPLPEGVGAAYKIRKEVFLRYWLANNEKGLGLVIE